MGQNATEEGFTYLSDATGPTTLDGYLSTMYHMTYRHGFSYLRRLTVLQKQDKRLACERSDHPDNLFLVAETSKSLNQRL